MKMWTRAEGTSAGEEDKEGREGEVGGSIVEKLDIL